MNNKIKKIVSIMLISLLLGSNFALINSVSAKQWRGWVSTKQSEEWISIKQWEKWVSAKQWEEWVSTKQWGKWSEKITFCHVPQGDNNNPITITTWLPAYERGHQNHELDYMGECMVPNIEIEKTSSWPNKIGTGIYETGYNIKVSNVGWTSSYTLHDNIELPVWVTSVVSWLSFVSDDDWNPVPTVNPLYNGIDQHIIITDEDILGSGSDEFSYNVTYTVDLTATPSDVNCNWEENSDRIILVKNTAMISHHENHEHPEHHEEKTCIELPIPDAVPKANFVASKIVCDDESYLPNCWTWWNDINESDESYDDYTDESDESYDDFIDEMIELDQINDTEKKEWINEIKILPTTLLNTWTIITEKVNDIVKNKVEFDFPVMIQNYLNENEGELEKYLYSNNISIKYKIAIAKFLLKLERSEKTKREKITQKTFSKIQNLEINNQNDNKMLNLLNYFKLKLAINYKKMF